MVNQESNGMLPQAPAHELETFLPQPANTKEPVIIKRKVDGDAEAAEFDPFLERKLDHPTSDMDTLTHLLKASLGTGILAMPAAFKASGLLLGVFFTLLAAAVCTHCSYILVKCAHVLYKKTRTTAMTFADVAQQSFEQGPACAKKYAYAFRLLVQISLFATYFGTCSVYTVIIAENLGQVVAHYMDKEPEDIDNRIIIAAFLVPLILMAWIRNLKYLAPVSMLANVFMGVSLCVTFYYLVGTGEFNYRDRPLSAPVATWPEFFSITIFAMEAIGVVMPLENSMKTPRSMLGVCGVLNKGMSGVTMVYILLGFLGYVRYENPKGAITLNLPPTDVMAQVVKVLVALAVYCTFALQFFVCVEIAWNGIKQTVRGHPVLADYVMRAVLVTLCVLLAIVFPTIKPLISIIGAFCFSILGLLSPLVIEMITYWEIGFGRWYWLVWKNLIVGLFGVLTLIFGTKNAVEGLIATYSKSAPSAH